MNKVRVREDIWELESQQEWHPITFAYALAVGEMQRRSEADPGDPTGWLYQSSVHSMNLPPTEPPDVWRHQCQHTSWNFLPWHRMYLYWFEEIARSIIEASAEIDRGTKSTWALPYWNYDRRGVTNTLPPPFRAKFLRDGRPNPLFVDERNKAPGRDLNNGDGMRDGRQGPISVTTARFALPATVFAGLGSFGGPRTGWHHMFENGIRTSGLLEATPHGSVHTEVGGADGLMSAFDTAALDPIFWLHHANIDRLWSVWLAQDQPPRANPTEAAWLTMESHFHDRTGADLKQRTEKVLDEVADLGYRYAEVTPPAGPMEAKPMSSGPAPEHPAELVGATSEPITLAGRRSTNRFPISPPAGPLAATAGSTPSRVVLTVEDMRAGRNPGYSYAVYLNVPDDDDDPANDTHYVGNVSFFGIEETTRFGGEHAGAISQALDVTALYHQLRDDGQWDDSLVTVTFVPILPDAGDVAGPESQPVEVGRIGLFFQ
ncbi:tyrosinase family protein [Paractinoplanes durhamensis]|uniref:Tyrosinase copper-binding domain-containing protein n=1 Tax=Paractinoplanes durhamensis TaxID=113563 RepID=A0ABQ3YUV3_9ACTN|nr:tyrosinase family protein [Actinoplanes durhamensis]GIE01378.1 hypothetical protein Adu01nite_27280 [Actinoplanes durhamensis]